MEKSHGIFRACPYPVPKKLIERVEKKSRELGESPEDVLLTALKKGLDDLS